MTSLEWLALIAALAFAVYGAYTIRL